MSFTPELLRASWRSWINYQAHSRVGPAWLQWAWTGLVCVGIAACFTAMGMFSARWSLDQLPVWFGRNLVVSMCIGVIIHLLYEVLGRYWATPARVSAWAPWQRTLYFSGVPMVGVAIGWPLGFAMLGTDVRRWFGTPDGSVVVLTSLALSVGVTLVLHLHFAARAREYRAEQQATEARLRLLQGQMEPHFLFNTLANVQSLIDFDPERAKLMLERFTDYLRSSLGQLRNDTTTLAHEFAMLEAYLALMQLRMGERLRVELSLPAELGGAMLPPMLVQPLVENAIHHGVEPRIAGGTVSVTARAAEGRLCIVVADDGEGLGAPRRRGGNGVALDNIRERLATRFGAAASLELLPRDGGGTLARIQLPLTDTGP
jgi:signal transduction histidine kinase